ncbi:MAG: hypothetical protein KKD39_09035, partial [Candidatus Altiarchaeota archaeon]|nr:hypothetical protein [Candidatus Altiarchaeota archaeon]
ILLPPRDFCKFDLQTLMRTTKPDYEKIECSRAYAGKEFYYILSPNIMAPKTRENNRVELGQYDNTQSFIFEREGYKIVVMHFKKKTQN